MIQLTEIILWSAYMSLEGIREAFYWSVVNLLPDNLKPKNAHPEFFIQRCIVFAAFAYISQQWTVILGMFLISPFFHNGMYYTIRNKIDHFYPKRWLDQSVNSTAWSTIYLTPVVRVTLFAIGIALIAYYFLIE